VRWDAGAKHGELDRGGTGGEVRGVTTHNEGKIWIGILGYGGIQTNNSSAHQLTSYNPTRAHGRHSHQIALAHLIPSPYRPLPILIPTDSSQHINIEYQANPPCSPLPSFPSSKAAAYLTIPLNQRSAPPFPCPSRTQPNPIPTRASALKPRPCQMSLTRSGDLLMCFEI
jgi:hypothetical protein